MTRTRIFEIEDGVCRTFTSVAVLKTWLNDRRWECESPEAFSKWLSDYFENGNEICVHGEQYSYLDCLELI